MKRLVFFVNFYFYNFVVSGDPFLLCFAASFIGEANYSKARHGWQGLFISNFNFHHIPAMQIAASQDAPHDPCGLWGAGSNYFFTAAAENGPGLAQGSDATARDLFANLAAILFCDMQT